MTDLIPITALGADKPQPAQFGALHLVEDNRIGLASLTLCGKARAPDGLPLPGPGGLVAAPSYGAFWIGPDQWMIEGPGKADGAFAAKVRAMAPAAIVTDQTDAWAVFEITSDAGAAPIEAMLSRLINIDLARFGPGQATRTGLDHMSVFVLRRSMDRVAILAMRSAAGSVWHALTSVAARLEGSACR